MSEQIQNQELKFDPKPIDFPALYSTAYFDTQSLCKLINNLFKDLFQDYYGSRIEIVQNRSLMCSIFFSDNSSFQTNEAPYRAIEPILQKDKIKSGEDKINAFNHVTSHGRQNNYQLTEQGKQLLSRVINNSFVNNMNGKIDWKKVTAEGSFQTNAGMYGSTKSYFQVMIDLVKILKAAYGSITDDGGRWQYSIDIGNPINPAQVGNGNTLANKWQIFVTRVNSNDVNKIAEEYGYTIDINNIGIVTK